MVLDYINNKEFYSLIRPDFLEAVEFALSLADKPVGKYEKNDYFALVQTGETKNIHELQFESHRKYLDVQIVVDGEEMLEWQTIDKLSSTTNYDSEKDCILYDGSGDVVKINKDMFYIMHTEDGHKPCCHIDKVTNYKKIVLKLALDK